MQGFFEKREQRDQEQRVCQPLLAGLYRCDKIFERLIVVM